MSRDSDSGDSGTLEHEVRLIKTVTTVTRTGTLLPKCPEVSPKCHSYCPQSVTHETKANHA